MTWEGVPLINHIFMGDLFALNNIFMDDLLAFDYTFMDELF